MSLPLITKHILHLTIFIFSFSSQIIFNQCCLILHLWKNFWSHFFLVFMRSHLNLVLQNLKPRVFILTVFIFPNSRTFRLGLKIWSSSMYTTHIPQSWKYYRFEVWWQLEIENYEGIEFITSLHENIKFYRKLKPFIELKNSTYMLTFKK